MLKDDFDNSVSLTRGAGKSNGRAMKTIGLIGGLSWESSIEYYRIINQESQWALG